MHTTVYECAWNTVRYPVQQRTVFQALASPYTLGKSYPDTVECHDTWDANVIKENRK